MKEIKHFVEILRVEESEQGTLSVMRINKQMFCATLEPPDRLNEVGRSSIPPGQYICRPYKSPKHGRTWQIMDVPGRTWVLFHKGNTVDDTEGCICVGSHPDKFRGDRAVLNSGRTFKRLVNRIGLDKPFHLTITEHY